MNVADGHQLICIGFCNQCSASEVKKKLFLERTARLPKEGAGTPLDLGLSTHLFVTMFSFIERQSSY